MAGHGGKTRTSGQGRPKGTPNKITGDLKAMILGALDKAGGVDYLVRQAEESPAAFMTLVGKVLPLQLTGKDDGPIEISVEAKMARAKAMLAEALGSEGT